MPNFTKNNNNNTNKETPEYQFTSTNNAGSKNLITI